MLQDIAAIVRDVIIIIVAATFIEMLLPRNEFHRYIRMVVGLLIILVLVSSVQQFLRIGPSSGAELFFAPVGQQRDLGNTLDGGESFFYQRLQAEYQARIEAEVERVVLDFSQEITKVRAQVAFLEESQFSGKLQNITLYLSVEKAGPGVEINPVVIEINPTPESLEIAPWMAREGQRVKEHVARHFQMEEGQVEIVFVNG